MERIAGHGVDVMILARNNLTKDARVMREAQALSAAGYHVVRVGIVTRHDDVQAEVTEFDHIVRVPTSRRPLAGGTPSRPSRTASHIAPYKGAVGAVRHWLGRMRENRLVFRAVREMAPTVVIACDLTMLPAGYLLKRRCHSRIVYDVHELYPETAYGRNWMYRWLYRGTESILMKRVDAVITVSEPRADYLMERYGIPQPVVVRNGPDRCMGPPRTAGTPLRILYQGGFQPGRGLWQLLEAVASVGEDIELYLQGFGALESELVQWVEDRNLQSKVRFPSPCRPEETVAEAYGYDLGVLFYEPTSLNNYLAAPNKLYDYLAAGLGFIGNRLPVLEAVARESGAGVIVHELSPEAIADVVRNLAANPSKVTELKRRAIESCPGYLWAEQAEKLIEVVESTLAGGRP